MVDETAGRARQMRVKLCRALERPDKPFTVSEKRLSFDSVDDAGRYCYSANKRRRYALDRATVEALLAGASVPVADGRVWFEAVRPIPPASTQATLI